MTHDEPWQVYAENGEAIMGLGKTREAFTDDLIMGASHIWIWRRKNDTVEVLLQKRATTKKTWPGFYDISAAGHIDVGENPVESAVREAKEEIGLAINPDKLLYIFSLRTPLAVNEIDHVYMYEVGADFVPSFDDGEVESVEWVTVDVFRQKVAHPTQNNLVDQGHGYFLLVLEYLSKI